MLRWNDLLKGAHECFFTLIALKFPSGLAEPLGLRLVSHLRLVFWLFCFCHMVALKNVAGKCLACAVVFGSFALLAWTLPYWPGSFSSLERIVPHARLRR